jgi:hypothetical protein
MTNITQTQRYLTTSSTLTSTASNSTVKAALIVVATKFKASLMRSNQQFDETIPLIN